jgi:uncharacterized protein YdiU (UPF0061 family)
MDAYHPDTVFSSIDTRGRYAYANQPPIAQWNLARLAEALLPLVEANADRAVAQVTEVLEAFPSRYQAYWLDAMRRKLGLATAQPDDLSLVNDFLGLLETQAVDFTLAFRGLSEAAEDPAYSRNLFTDLAGFDTWAARWRERLSQEPSGANGQGATHADAMRRVNPAYVPRNHRVEEALAAAVERGDHGPFEQLLAVLTHPFDARAEWAAYGQPASAAEAEGYRTFCGT